MRKIIIIFTFIFTIGLTGNVFADNRVPVRIVQAFRAAGLPVYNEGIPIRDFSLVMLDGINFTLSQQRGKVVFLNFWATWCPPCRDEMPSMESLYQKLKARDFIMAAVNLREERNHVAAFMNQYKLTFPAFLDARGAAGSMYSVRAIPTTYIIDKRGLIISRLEGSINWDTPAIVAALELLLAE